MVIVTHPEIAPGFRLAGVEVYEAEDAQEAGAIIRRMCMLDVGRKFGIIGLDEDMNNQLDPKLLEEIEERGIPLLIPFPAKEIYTWVRIQREEDYTANLIRGAIGYHIKLKR